MRPSATPSARKHLALSEQLLLLKLSLKNVALSHSIYLCYTLNVEAKCDRDRRQKVAIPTESQQTTKDLIKSEITEITSAEQYTHTLT